MERPDSQLGISGRFEREFLKGHLFGTTAPVRLGRFTLLRRLGEAAMLRAWGRGDADAGRRLIDAVYPRIVRYFRNKVACSGDEADLVQRSLLGLCEAHDRLGDDASFWPFLYGIARNVLFDYVPQRLRRERQAEDLDGVSVRELDRSAVSIVTGKREIQAFFEALRALPLADQTLLEFRFVEAMKAREIADALGIPRGSVHREISRSIERLQELVADRLRSTGAGDVECSVDQFERWAATLRSL